MAAVAPAPATEVEPVSDDWTSFRRSATERLSRPRRTLKEIQISSGDVLREYSGGTVTASEWVPAVMHALTLETVKTALLDDYRAVDFVWRTRQGIVVSEIKIGKVELAVDVEHDPASPLPESALIAREVRDLSGLGAQRLGEIFPVERESYQRWLSGKTQPSAANLERLLALRHFWRELANRVPDPKSWVLAPLAEGTSSGSRYEALKVGNLAALWDEIADLPSRAKRYTRDAGDGSTLTVTEGSLRGRDIRTTAEELDDYEDWLSEDE